MKVTINGNRMIVDRESKYCTDDKEDAISTARHMFKSFLSADL